MSNLDLNRVIAQAEKYSLSDDDIREYMKGDVNIVSYLDLPNVAKLEDLFMNSTDGSIRSNNVVFHIPVGSQSAGHWTCGWLDGDTGTPVFHYWCPYGFSIHENITKSPYLMHSEDRDDYALVYLVKQFVKEGGKVIQNPFRLQVLKYGVNTCGRHCIARLLHKQMSNRQYYDYMNSLVKTKKLTPDELVSLVMLW